jgi:hypothetical protein
MMKSIREQKKCDQEIARAGKDRKARGLSKTGKAWSDKNRRMDRHMKEHVWVITGKCMCW